MFYAINDVWKPALASVANLTDGIKCVKFVIGEKKLLSMEPEIQARCLQLETEEGLTLGPILEKDIKRMLELNGVKYSEFYGRHIIKRSHCFRDRAGEMVAWAGTHEDFSIAALHVLPEYRKMGLGRLVLQNIALMHVRLAREVFAAGSDPEATEHLEIFAHADCLMHNVPTMVFMERCGWHRAGHHLWLGLLPSPESSVE
ncbi:hypothetical protein EDD21DRAFT_206550 [Dissophora ornata]|nr:hypothetical protein EDD21DRAFT_206550 [Dissophora ornata]